MTTNRGVDIAGVKKFSQRLILVIGGAVTAGALLFASPAGLASAAPALVTDTGVAVRGGWLLNDDNGILPGKGNGSSALKQGQAVGKFVQRAIGAARTACNIIPAGCTGPPPVAQNPN